jgi:hypothetical protein
MHGSSTKMYDLFSFGNWFNITRFPLWLDNCIFILLRDTLSDHLSIIYSFYFLIQKISIIYLRSFHHQAISTRKTFHKVLRVILQMNVDTKSVTQLYWMRSNIWRLNFFLLTYLSIVFLLLAMVFINTMSTVSVNECTF